MADPWQIQVFEKQQLVYSGDFEGSVEIGRQGEGSEVLYSRRADADRARLVIAGRDEDSISRKHALLEPAPGGRIKLTNLSAKVPIRLLDGSDVRPAQSREVALPAFLLLGRKSVKVQHATVADEEPVECLREATIPPGAGLDAPSAFGTLALPGGAGLQDIESLVRWLRSTLDVFQSATGATDFFQKAAQAVVENVGMDSGQVLMLERGEWAVQAVRSAHGQPADEAKPPSRHVLGRLQRERRTFWRTPQQASAQSGSGIVSLLGLSSVVAAPILDRRGEVIGALYGDRRLLAGAGLPARAGRVDALLVELLAGGVAGGLLRLDQEKQALAARVQFEQFFTPELARVLAERPEMLKGHDAEISALFCDIRGFSRISHNIATAQVVEWIGDVMGALSDCVRAHQGVLVDYIGDELVAMWGAPEEQPDHARLASRAALDMLDLLPSLNRRWMPTLGEPMGLGIGINTGMARVGNTGSHHKFKYGPLGNTVNLASRVQGVTKYLKSRLLVTGATHERLGPDFPSRRVGRVRVVNINEPVELYELGPAADPAWDELRKGYMAALDAFEAREFHLATRILGNMLLEHPEDGPSLVLLSRVVNCLVDADKFDPVFEPPGK